MSNTPTIQVSDYLTAAVLVAQSLEIQDSILVRSGRISFLFSDPDGLVSRLIQAHERGELLVNSRAMTTAIHSVKSILFETRRNAGAE